MAQTGRNQVDVGNDALVDVFRAVVGEGCALLVHEEFFVGQRTVNVGDFLRRIVEHQQVDGLHFGNRVDGGMVQQRNHRVFHQKIEAVGTAVELRADIVTRLECSVHKIVVRNGRILRVVVGTERELPLIGVFAWIGGVFTASHRILSALRLLQIGVEACECVVELRFGDFDVVVDFRRIAVIDRVFEGFLIEVQRVDGIVEIEARSESENGDECPYKLIFFHDFHCFRSSFSR